jgi:CDP-diacylglycerol--glycerol-3-phosphate 3-phosphatidyltransferase
MLDYPCAGEGCLSIYELKPRFQALLRPLTRALYNGGVTANQVTVTACAISLALGVLLAFEAQSKALFLLVPLWLLLRMALNAVDGMLAREFGQKSALGAYLNELTDVVSDTALYLPFALLPGSNPWLLGAVAGLAMISEMAGALAPMVGAARRYDGPMGKSDRAFVFGALGLLVGLGVPLAAAFDWIWLATIALLAVTIANRVRNGVAAAK